MKREGSTAWKERVINDVMSLPIEKSQWWCCQQPVVTIFQDLANLNFLIFIFAFIFNKCTVDTIVIAINDNEWSDANVWSGVKVTLVNDNMIAVCLFIIFILLYNSFPLDLSTPELQKWRQRSGLGSNVPTAWCKFKWSDKNSRNWKPHQRQLTTLSPGRAIRPILFLLSSYC